MTLPTPIDIDPRHHKQLLQLNLEMFANQELIQKFQTMMQQKLVTQRQQAQALWQEIARIHQLDLSQVSWEPHETEPKIVPVSMALKQQIPQL